MRGLGRLVDLRWMKFRTWDRLNVSYSPCYLACYSPITIYVRLGMPLSCCQWSREFKLTANDSIGLAMGNSRAIPVTREYPLTRTDNDHDNEIFSGTSSDYLESIA